MPLGLDARAVDHLAVVFGDVEMGAGGVTDDFPATEWLGDLLLGYSEGPFRHLDVTIVFNGDTFDFLKTPLEGRWPTHVDAPVALGKLDRVLAAHPDFFDAVSAFCRTGPGARRVAFLQGNHDQELAFTEVQRAIRGRVAPPSDDAVSFPGFSLRHGDLHVEHGSQQDPMFSVEPHEAFVNRDGRQLLNLPWGSVALLEVVVPLTPILYHHDRLVPREQLFELLPDVRELLLGAFWRYWTRDYWQAYFADDDPLRHVSWTMLKEIVHQFGARVMDVNVGRAYRKLVESSNDIATCVIGHQHRAAWWSVGAKKVLRTSCYRNEFALVDDGRSQRLLPKVHAEVYSRRGQTVRSHLVEVEGPPPRADSVPESIFDVAEPLREALGQRAASSSSEGERRARREQEAREAEARPAGLSSTDVWRSLRRALARE